MSNECSWHRVRCIAGHGSATRGCDARGSQTRRFRNHTTVGVLGKKNSQCSQRPQRRSKWVMGLIQSQTTSFNTFEAHITTSRHTAGELAAGSYAGNEWLQ